MGQKQHFQPLGACRAASSRKVSATRPNESLGNPMGIRIVSKIVQQLSFFAQSRTAKKRRTKNTLPEVCPGQQAALQLADAKRSSKGQSMEPDCDVENLKIQTKSKASVQNNGCRSKLTPAKRSSTGQSMEPDCDVEELKKSSKFEQQLRKIRPGGTPREATN